MTGRAVTRRRYSRRSAGLARALATAVGALALAQPLAGRAPEPIALRSLPQPDGMPRDQTLYTTGTATAAPANFDPLVPSAYTGTMGLLYEPLFLFDPAKGKLLPWLATSGTWTGLRQYRIQVRPGAYWVDSGTGKQMGEVSAADVAYSLRLARSSPTDPYHVDVAGISSVAAQGQTVTVDFLATVNHPLWDSYLWHAPVLPKAFWSTTRTSASAPGGAQPVATGPMLLYKVSQSGACFRRDPYWWGNTQLHVQLHFEYLCDEVTPSPGRQLPALLGGKLDWTNSLLSGAANLGGYPGTGYGVTMYYPSQPYMLPANTQWLKFDLRRWPMSSPDFRRAVAYASNPAKVASDDYAGAVEPSGPLGLLPSLSAYVDEKTVARYGFHFSTARARALLRQCGYKGQPLRLEVIAGNRELTDAAGTISAQLRASGIVVSVVNVSSGRYQSDMASGNYDLALAAGTGPAPTPWQYFEASLGTHQGVAAGMQSEASRLLATAAATPINEQARLRAIYGNLEKIFLQQLPVVPLWYSGAWFEASTSHWRGYPSSVPKSDHYTPVMWRGWLGATTTVLALAQLSPSAKHH